MARAPYRSKFRRRDRPAGAYASPPAPVGLGLSGEPAPAYGSPLGLSALNPAAGAGRTQGGPAWSDIALGAGIGLLTGDNWGEGAGQGLLYAKQFADQRADRERQARLDQMNEQKFGLEMGQAQQAADDRKKLGESYQMFLGRITDDDPTNDVPGFTKEQGMFMAGLPAEQGYEIAAPFLFPKPKERKTTEIAGRLVDAETGEVIKDLSDAEIALRQASRPVTNIQMPTLEKERDKELGKIHAETIKQWQSDANAATETMAQVQQMRGAVDRGLQTGQFADIRQVAANVAIDLGLDQNTVNTFFNTADAKEFSNASNKMVLSMVKMLGPNPSNADRDFIVAAIPTMKDNPQAISAVLDRIQASNERYIQKYQQGYADFAKGGDPLQFDLDWAAKYGLGGQVPQQPTVPNAPPAETPAPTPAPAPDGIPTISSPAEAAKLPKGTKFRDPNGVLRTVP